MVAESHRSRQKLEWEAEREGKEEEATLKCGG